MAYNIKGLSIQLKISTVKLNLALGVSRLSCRIGILRGHENNNVTGLLGNNNGDSADDLKLENGTSLSNTNDDKIVHKILTPSSQRQKMRKKKP